MSKQEFLPVLISRNIVVFPGASVTIEIGREMSIAATFWSQIKFKKEIVLICQKDYDNDAPKSNDLYSVGTLCKIIDSKLEEDGSFIISLKGLQRIKTSDVTLKNPVFENEKEKKSFNFPPKLKPEQPFWITNYKIIKVRNSNVSSNIHNEINKLISHVEEIFGNESTESKTVWEIAKTRPEKTSLIVDLCAQFWPIDNENLVSVKQKWLETTELTKRIELILAYDDLNSKAKEEIDEVITRKVHNNISKQQKEFYLRERIKVIKEELGENPAKDEEINKIKDRLKNEPFPSNVREKVLAELNKLEFTASFSNEAIISKNYIDWVMSIPWWEITKDQVKFFEVENVLNKNHYGLEKVKDRILDFLTVQKRKGNQSGATIICLVGPPGVGKTSLVTSIAEALKRKFVKISLGGVSDESEIRGHRKTYIGSMPGRIIKGMKKAGVCNPIFLLDEIDKLTADHRGDPSSALLEVLDPSQNKHFSDNYIEEEYDLSKVMFIATANYEENIPHALHDRMEVINLTSYTSKEKLEIAKSHLISEVLNETNIKPSELKFSDDALNYIINHYTREAGVRNLKRHLLTIARKFIRAQETNSKFKETINVIEVQKYLKKEIFEFNIKDEKIYSGVVNGMAYTEFGGDLLPIEVTHYKGSGKIIITGNLKQTMQESATVALSYVKANAKEFGVDKINFEEIDVNIHVPSGGVPKDGPSAGIALTSAIISSLRKQPVDSSISMTGEITLRGKVMIIGGVKEKIISAVRGGVNKIFIPKADERYLVDIPKEILEKTEIILVENYFEIFNCIFGDKINHPVPQKPITRPTA